MNKIVLLILTLYVLPSAAQNTSNAEKAATEVHRATSAYGSPIESISLKAPIAPPTPAQAKDHLLWYKGKRIDDSTLITTNATLVRWSKPRDRVIVQLKKDPFVKMIKELEKNESKKQQFYDKMSERRNVLTLYSEVVTTMQEYDYIYKAYGEILKNSIALPPAITNATSLKINFKTGGVASFTSKWVRNGFVIPEIKKAYEEVMQLMKNYPPIEFPPPPDMEFGTCSTNECDSVKNNNLIEKRENWKEDFTRYEADIINKSIGIIKTLQLLGIEEDDPEFSAIEAGLDKAMKFAYARINNKIDLLTRKYSNDFKKLPAVIQVVISAERQKQLLGASDENTSGPLMAKLSDQLEGLEKYMEQQMDAKNYDVVLNTAFFLGVERQRQLLGASDEDRTYALFEKMISFNRFRIDLKVDYETFVDPDDCGGKTKVTATNIDPTYVSLARILGCKYSFVGTVDYAQKLPRAWYLYYSGAYEIPLIVTNGYGVEILTRDDGSCYTKTHNLTGLNLKSAPGFNAISFCEEGSQDSIQFGPTLELYREKDKLGDHMNSYMTEMQNDGYQSELPDSIEQISNELDEISLKVKEKELETFQKPSIQQLQEDSESLNRFARLSQKEIEYEERDHPSTIIFDAKNGSPDIVDATTTLPYDGSYTPHEDKATLTFKIKVVHDPMPYKTIPAKK